MVVVLPLDLDLILTWRQPRRVSNTLTVQDDRLI